MKKYSIVLVVMLAAMLGGCTTNIETEGDVAEGVLEVQFLMPKNIGGGDRNTARTSTKGTGIGTGTGINGMGMGMGIGTNGTVIAPDGTVTSGTGTSGSAVSCIIPYAANLPQTRIGGTAEEILEGENRLNTMVIMIFSGDGTKLENMLYADLTSGNIAIEQPKWANQKTLTIKDIKDRSKKKIIYAIANWALPADFDQSTYTAAQLEDEIIARTSLTEMNEQNAYPIVMSGKTEVASFSAVGYRATIEIKRMVAKIRAGFTLSTQTQSYHPNIKWESDLMKIAVVGVPNKSFVMDCGGAPIVRGQLEPYYFAVDDTKPADGSQATPPAPPTTALQWAETFYTHELPIEGDAEYIRVLAIHLIVQLPYTDRTTGITDYDNYYQLYIKDTRPSEIKTPYSVRRNMYYMLNIGIMGIGSPLDNLQLGGNITANVEVEPWTDGEHVVIDNPRLFLSADRTSIEFQKYDDPNTEEINIATNVEEWTLVDAAGTILLSHATGTTTGSDNAFTYQVAATGPVAGDGTGGGIGEAAPGQKYKITITRKASNEVWTKALTLRVKNLKIPITALDDNGFIPNSILKQGYRYSPGTPNFPGWPADRLPSRGLQIAKRGNVLPSDKPKDTDPMCQWATTEENLHIKNKNLSYGKGNTDVIFQHIRDEYEYPAATMCRDLGPGWYLPSFAELGMIYRLDSYWPDNALGSSYRFHPAKEYWTSTEFWGIGDTGPDTEAYSEAIIVNFGGGANSNKFRSNISVRCVKNI